jgi:hypothetical protein
VRTALTVVASNSPQWPLGAVLEAHFRQPLTGRQAEVYRALVALYGQLKRPVAYSELMAATGLQSRSSVHRYLALLEMAGWIKDRERMASGRCMCGTVVPA